MRRRIPPRQSRQQAGPRPDDERGVPGQRTKVQQPDGGGEVGGGDVAALRDRADGVVEAQAGVPERVPEPVGERGDPPPAPPVVHEHEVEVAGGAGVAPGDASDGGEGDSLHIGTESAAGDRVLPGAGEGLLDEVRECLPSRVPGRADGEREALTAQVPRRRPRSAAILCTFLAHPSPLLPTTARRGRVLCPLSVIIPAG